MVLGLVGLKLGNHPHGFEVGWSKIGKPPPWFWGLVGLRLGNHPHGFGGRFIKIARFCSLSGVQSLQLEMERAF